MSHFGNHFRALAGVPSKYGDGRPEIPARGEHPSIFRQHRTNARLNQQGSVNPSENS